MVKRVGLVGVTGYTGMELTRILLGHPGLRLTQVTSRKEAGQPLQKIYPFLQGTELGELEITAPDSAFLAANCDLVFLAVPHCTAMEMAAELRGLGARVVDLSADFRLRDHEVYESWYQVPHTRTALLTEAVYGLPELYAARIAGAGLVANPGCYPTSAILALYPALAAGLISPEDLVIDSKSGTTGAGRKAGVGTLFCEVSDTFRAYNLTKHRHTPEIEQELSLAAGREIRLSFNTHLLPINRGILTTAYAKLSPGADLEQIRACYQEFYAGKRWVRLLPQGSLPETRWVRGTNFCDLGLVTDPRTDRLIVVSAIDNLCRGASGQAVANANLMLGLEEGVGLPFAPLMP
ncbi:MAG: N-acetyl-gamma-glutamyl-phosphate reductase [Deltaproteobacteria bacterium HGW-Deltaproteobacteria-18]|jgi:N-acetyl-gamma-glutamyl-phosphate reductase|nr:MAG: N-acetyl-gamma-glutamyl-phosphate reductase [Deltaproteobacteria bacterium HGW-Deltaproteobacteria-18]